MSILKRRIRQKRKEYRFGNKAHCEFCKERDLRTLDEFLGHTICRSCRLALLGKSTIEKHHVSGRHNDNFLLDLPANEHAILSDYQQDWPEETMKNPNKDVLIEVAASIRAIQDMYAYSIERPPMLATTLEALGRFLKDRFGDDWAEGFDPSETELTK